VHRLITGVDFVVVPTDASRHGVCRQAIFADPDGNPLVLHRRYAPANPKPAVDGRFWCGFC
jgi:hypothetical protein